KKEKKKSIKEGPRGGRYYINDQNKKVYIGRRQTKIKNPVHNGKIGKKTVIGAVHVKAWSAKRNREYEHIKESELARGRSEKVASRIAAATVNKIRSMHGETKS